MAGARIHHPVRDATPINGGRDFHLIRELAARAEMHIIAATCFYYFGEHLLKGWEVDRFVEFLIRDIESGIQDIAEQRSSREGGLHRDEE